jgi:transcriptional regulator
VITEKELKVLQLRKTGMTQVEVAKKLGISQAAISSFENSGLRKLEDAEEILKLAKELGIKTQIKLTK